MKLYVKSKRFTRILIQSYEQSKISINGGFMVTLEIVYASQMRYRNGISSLLKIVLSPLLYLTKDLEPGN